VAPYSSNRLLASLSEGSRNHLLARCESVLLEQRTIIHVEEETPPYAYFLESGFASVVATMQGGETAEVEMIGSEGVVGAFGLLGPSNIPIPTRCFIQMSAEARRLPTGELRKAFEGIPEVRERISSFFQAELATLMQIAGCHRVHEAEQRLSRWMLMAHDRVGGDTLRLTQEFLAEMLGTRRTTVTEVAGSLQRQGYIEYQRGAVRIVDRAGLESAACDCYNIVRRIYQNIYT
jgi:CRP-like cAMP-binding protein